MFSVYDCERSSSVFFNDDKWLCIASIVALVNITIDANSRKRFAFDIIRERLASQRAKLNITATNTHTG
jgi:hypothetical protein